MSQTLTAYPLISIPVTPAQNKVLAGNLAAIKNMDNRMVVALAILGKIHLLAVVNSQQNYIANHRQMRNDATAFMGVWQNPGEFTCEPPQRMQAISAWNAGSQIDPTLSTSVNALVIEMAGLRETPENTLNMIYQFLVYSLACNGT